MQEKDALLFENL